MTFWRVHLGFVVRLALAAVLALSLMPTVSHALAWSRALQHADGQAKHDASDAAVHQHHATNGSAKHGLPSVHFDHCPFCAQAGTAVGAPPAPLSAPLLAGGLQDQPRLFYSAPRPLFAWQSAQPRAPPAVFF